MRREQRKKDKVKEYRIGEYDATVRFYESSYCLATVYLKIGPVVISGMAIRKNKDGDVFIGWPARKREDGTYKNMVYTVDSNLSERIIDAYYAWEDER